MGIMFELLKQRFSMGFLCKEQLRKYVQIKKITPEQYQEITEETYVG